MSNLQNKRLVLWPKSSSLLVYIGSSEQDAETCTLGGFTWTPILKFAKCYRDTFHLAYFHFWPSFFFKRFWNDKSPLLLINRIPHPLSSECRPYSIPVLVFLLSSINNQCANVPVLNLRLPVCANVLVLPLCLSMCVDVFQLNLGSTICVDV